jgi:drug/metabolite transporter (DMT)-like permease
MISCIKEVSDRIPAGESVFFRSLFALVPLLPFMIYRGEFWSSIRTKHYFSHWGRGFVGVLSMATWFMAIGMLPLPEAFALGYASPLIAVVLAVVMLGETVRFFRWACVIVGFAGIVIIVWPGLTLLQAGELEITQMIGAICALASSAFAALAVILVRRLLTIESSSAIVLHFSINSSLLALLTMPLGWVWPTPWEGGLLVLSGILGGVGQILLTESYRHADTSTIAPFDYVSMLWGILFGYLFFDEIPTLYVIIGSAIVILAGMAIIIREQQLARLERTAMRSAR